MKKKSMGRALVIALGVCAIVLVAAWTGYNALLEYQKTEFNKRHPPLRG
jgi:hypothetical protein